MNETAKQQNIIPKLVEYELSDGDSDFSADSANDVTFQAPETITDLSDDDWMDLESKKAKPTRKRKRFPEKWKENVVKARRAKCIGYKNKYKECPAKNPKSIKISEAERMEICKEYWGFSNFIRQKEFILKFVEVGLPKRRKVDTDDKGARQCSKAYFLESGKVKYRVCAKFFEKTLCISNKPVRNAVAGASSNGSFALIDQRGRKDPSNKTSKTVIAKVREHIESFPTMEAHYVRKSSQKLYLEAGLSVMKMYDMYVNDFCVKNNLTPVQACTYRRTFCNNYNLSFFKPKKDLCATCTKYAQASLEKKQELETDYSLHLLRKTDCNEAKDADKLRSKYDSSFATCTFDLQSVLQLPYSGVSSFYYARKISVYNLTIYVGYGEIAHCYTWNELNGKRGSNEIGSILYHFLQTLPDTVSEISLFCDTCGGQNRNKQVAAILLYVVSNIPHLKTIELKFLESGHSHMECDSMHSAIESARKHKTAYSMTDWVNIFESARMKRAQTKFSKERYKVHLLRFADFYNLVDLASALIKNRNQDENGEKMIWIKAKCLKFEKNHPGIMFYRYDHTSEYKRVLVAGKGRPRKTPLHLKAAYTKLLPIQEEKKADLMKLVDAGLIPEELHPWYKSLPTCPTKQRSQSDSQSQQQDFEEMEQ